MTNPIEKPMHLNHKTSLMTAEHPYEALVLRSLFAVLAILVCAYLYFVSSSVLNVIARKEAAAAAVKTESNVGVLEQQYLALTHGVTPEQGLAMGLQPIKSATYVRRMDAVGVVSSDTHAI
jgi:hypothetical protein